MAAAVGPVPVPAVPRTVQGLHAQIDFDALWALTDSDVRDGDLCKFSCTSLLGSQKPLPVADINPMTTRCAVLCDTPRTTFSSRVVGMDADVKRVRLARALLLLSELHAPGGAAPWATWPAAAQPAPGAQPATAPPAAGAPPPPVLPAPQPGTAMQPPAGQPAGGQPATVPPPGGVPPPATPTPGGQQQPDAGDPAIDLIYKLLGIAPGNPPPGGAPAPGSAPVDALGAFDREAAIRALLGKDTPGAQPDLLPTGGGGEHDALRRRLLDVLLDGATDGGKRGGKKTKTKRKRRRRNRGSYRDSSGSSASSGSSSDDEDAARDDLTRRNRRRLHKEGRIVGGVLVGDAVHGLGVACPLPPDWHKKVLRGELGFNFASVVAGGSADSKTQRSFARAIAATVVGAGRTNVAADDITLEDWCDVMDCYIQSVALVYPASVHVSNLRQFKARVCTCARLFGISPAIRYERMIRDNATASLARLGVLSDFGDLFHVKTACFSGQVPVLCTVPSCPDNRGHCTGDHDRVMQQRAAGRAQPASLGGGGGAPGRVRFAALPAPAAGRPAPHAPRSTPTAGVQQCKNFNAGRPCFKTPCLFAHTCTRCGGGHPEKPPGAAPCSK